VKNSHDHNDIVAHGKKHAVGEPVNVGASEVPEDHGEAQWLGM
jgi:hypothetical protein